MCRRATLLKSFRAGRRGVGNDEDFRGVAPPKMADPINRALGCPLFRGVCTRHGDRRRGRGRKEGGPESPPERTRASRSRGPCSVDTDPRIYVLLSFFKLLQERCENKTTVRNSCPLEWLVTCFRERRIPLRLLSAPMDGLLCFRRR